MTPPATQRAVIDSMRSVLSYGGPRLDLVNNEQLRLARDDLFKESLENRDDGVAVLPMRW